jgi:hypothetical protein
VNKNRKPSDSNKDKSRFYSAKKLIFREKMHKILSVLSLAGFIVSSIKADATFQPANQPSQAASDAPQTPYVPAATYQSSDTLTVAIAITVEVFIS